MTRKILVTGASGYIGSHSCLELLKADYEIVALDNLSNSSIEAIDRVQAITGKELTFIEGNILDEHLLLAIFERHSIQGVIHFAGLKSVAESMSSPTEYYLHNVAGSLNLCRAMARSGVKSLVFSSSATVYGNPEALPIPESAVRAATNPYGQSKIMIEQMLGDISAADNGWNIVILRYFNPVGAHSSGAIGEEPRGTPNNLMPYITAVATGRLEKLSVFGNDYNTPDGTGVRDYIHVVDLAMGHVQALKKIQGGCGLAVFNLGTGKGYSVLEVVKAFDRANAVKIPFQLCGRRPGDIDACYADPSRALNELDWRATRNLDDMVRDAWNWQKANPGGYDH